MKKSLAFISELKKNNNRDWFQAHRKQYEEARAEFLAFIEALVGRLATFDPDLGTVEPKSTLFRINRDIRFSRDKSPYKTNFGAYIKKGGRKSGLAGYYFHIEPGECFIGGGIYHPEPDVLKKIRQEIYGNPEEFREILEDKKFRSSFGELYDHQLKTAPKGFPKDFEHMDLLRYQSYMVSRTLPEEVVTGDTLLVETADSYRLMYPLVRFINYALD